MRAPLCVRTVAANGRRHSVFQPGQTLVSRPAHGEPPRSPVPSPCPAVGVHARAAPKPIEHHLLVVAAYHRSEPRSVPLQGIVAARAVVDEVPDAEQAISNWIMVERLKRALHSGKAAVNVGEDQISPACGIWRDFDDELGYLLVLGVGIGFL